MEDLVICPLGSRTLSAKHQCRSSKIQVVYDLVTYFMNTRGRHDRTCSANSTMKQLNPTW